MATPNKDTNAEMPEKRGTRPRECSGLYLYIVETAANERNLWYESPEEAARAFAESRHRERLMRWVRWQMKRRLKWRERRAVELHYLEEKSFREIGQLLGVSPAGAHRLAQAGILKLRRAARASNVRVTRRRPGPPEE
jgi:DNA-directed RNA polymerase specialized sigma subunit